MTTTGQALQAVARHIATDSRDWGLDRGDAWLYGVLVGWDCEETHDHEAEFCEGGALGEVADRHGWTAAHRSRIKELRQAVKDATVAEPPEPGMHGLDFGGGFLAVFCERENLLAMYPHVCPEPDAPAGYQAQPAAQHTEETP